MSRGTRKRFSGRLFGERFGSWWKTIRVQSAYRPAVLEWERASDPRSPLAPGVLCGGAPDFHGMLFGLLHGRRSPLAPPALCELFAQQQTIQAPSFSRLPAFPF